MTNYTGLWKILYDWQTIIAGALAIFAAIIGGGMAYQAGRVQAKATRKAADLQVAPMNAQLAHLKAEKQEAERRAHSEGQKREIAQINVAISGISYNIELLLHVVSDFIIPHYNEVQIAFTMLQEAQGDSQKLQQITTSFSPSNYPALRKLCPELHFIEWDFFKEVPFIVEKDPELLKNTGWIHSQSHELNTAIKNRNASIMNAVQMTMRQGELKTADVYSILYFQKSVSDAECLISSQLFAKLLDTEKRLEAVNNTYEIKARKLKITTPKTLGPVLEKLDEILKTTAPESDFP